MLDWQGGVNFAVNNTTSSAWTNNYIVARSSSVLSANTWYHIALTYGGGTNPATTLEIYVDGSLDVGLALTVGTFTTPRNSSFDILIGTLDVGSVTDLQGKIASFEFYVPQLDSNQIKTLYDLQSAIQTGTYIGNGTATLGRVSTEQFFPRGAISARSGQFVNLEDSPGTDSIAYAGMKR